MELIIESLWVYPIKSCAGSSLPQARLQQEGVTLDRRWMLIDAQGRFMSQRSHARMARIKVAIKADHLLVSAPWMDAPTRVGLDQEMPHGELRLIDLWGDQVHVREVSAQTSAWMSQAMGQPCQLVVKAGPPRLTDVRYLGQLPAPSAVALADGFPLLIVHEASLRELNRHLSRPVAMSRFRPNVVVRGGQPWDEDRWDALQVEGQGLLWCVKPCSRCAVINVEQHTATRSPAGEPLKTLARLHAQGQKVIFGQNALIEDVHTLHVGQRLRAISREA